MFYCIELRRDEGNYCKYLTTMYRDIQYAFISIIQIYLTFQQLCMQRMNIDLLARQWWVCSVGCRLECSECFLYSTCAISIMYVIEHIGCQTGPRF